MSTTPIVFCFVSCAVTDRWLEGRRGGMTCATKSISSAGLTSLQCKSNVQILSLPGFFIHLQTMIGSEQLFKPRLLPRFAHS